MEIECQGSASEIFTKLKTQITDLRSKGKLSVIKDIQFNDGSKSAKASGSGYDADIQCVEGKVVVSLKLGLLLKPMRGTIEEGLRARLESVLKA